MLLSFTAIEFQKEVSTLRKMEDERADRRIAAYQETHKTEQDVNKAAVRFRDFSGSDGDSNNKDINLLIEIVSAADLPVTDLTSTDPFVSVWLGARKIHQTSHVSKK